MSTDFDFKRAKIRTVSAISGSTVTVGASFIQSHFGSLQYFAASWDPKVVLNERAEVVRLTRNILIKGASDSSLDNIGGHLMVQAGGQAFISNVEFAQMGKRGSQGRYPVHFHLVNDATGQYIKNSSIHDSFNRCITLHGTSNVIVSNNVCYDHYGHGFFLEDGSEMGNLVDRNVVALTRSPLQSDALLATDNSTLSSFWITNPNNTFTNNVAGGGDMNGFWFAFPASPTGLSKTNGINAGLVMNTVPFKEFSFNKAHSYSVNFGFDNGIADEPENQFPLSGPFYVPTSGLPYYIRNITSYKARDRSFWTRIGGHLIIQNLVSADSSGDVGHLIFAWKTGLQRSLIVGYSANSYPGIRGTAAIGLYDGPNSYSDILLANFPSPAIAIKGAMEKRRSKFARVSFYNCTSVRVGFTLAQSEATPLIKMSPNATLPEYFNTIIEDTDGSISGSPKSLILPIMNASYNGQVNANEFNVFAPKCTKNLSLSGWVCKNVMYSLLRISTPGNTPQGLMGINVTRSDGISMIGESGPLRNQYHYAVVTSENLSYGFAIGHFGTPLPFYDVSLNYGSMGERLFVTITGANRMKISKVLLNAGTDRRSDSFKLEDITSLAQLQSSKTTGYYFDQANNIVTILLVNTQDNGIIDAAGDLSPWANGRSARVRVYFSGRLE